MVAVYSGSFLTALGEFVNNVALEANDFNEATQISKITEVKFKVSNSGGDTEEFTLEVHPETGEGGVILER